jgi:hypothetical protein
LYLKEKKKKENGENYIWVFLSDIRLIKSRMIQWFGQVALTGKIINVYTILIQ